MEIKPVDMQSDTFEQMKNDMTVILNNALRQMQLYGSDEGSVTVKIKIGLSRDDDDPEILIPTFEHKTSYSVPVKGELEGELPGRYALTKEGFRYALQPLGKDQMSVFDDISELSELDK